MFSLFAKGRRPKNGLSRAPTYSGDPDVRTDYKQVFESFQRVSFMMDPAAAAAVHAVSLKLPTFLASRPDVWFQQTEAQFALRKITDSTTQYFYLLTALDPVVAERMAGEVAAVPREDKYTYLKGKLMEVYGLTDDQKADRLLGLEIGNLPNSVHTSKASLLTSSSTHFPTPIARGCPGTGSRT